MVLFLGVDGGQSSTTALVADETGRVLGYGRAGPCNHVRGPAGREKFVVAIEGCLKEAGAAAGIDALAARYEAACLGFSGGPADKRSILEQMLRVERLIVTTDALIALAGATAGGPGVIVIAGTGSIAFGRDAGGRTARAGGWGYIFGDEGGGFDITRQALRAILRAEEGWGSPTALRDALLADTGAADANDLLHRFYTSDYPRPRIASYARLVGEVALAGDSVAREILEDAAARLAGFAGAVRSTLALDAACPVAHIGGVFRSDIVRERFSSLVGGSHAPRFAPAAGALLEAYRAAGLRPALSNLPEAEK
jgi:N-acetylglucosamine kinase-like BadF-type ATPase